MIFGIFTTLASFLGIFGIFTSNAVLVFIGAAFNIIETVTELKKGTLNSPINEIVAIGIGAIYAAWNPNVSIWLGIAMGLCWDGTIFGIISIPSTIATISSFISFMRAGNTKK